MYIIYGYILDLILGDPYFLYHPVRMIGNLITFLEKLFVREHMKKNSKYIAGFFIFIITLSLSYLVPFFILYFLRDFKYLILIKVFMAYQIFATRSLDKETKKVYKSLKNNDINKARKYISYLVSRDTKNMSEKDIIKAAIETIAENLADGVIAPMIFMFLGGIPLAFLYKGVNTLDSMVGYKNEKYNELGYVSAKMDDVFNYIPARLTSIFVVIVSFILRFDYKNSIRILKRDKRNHESPNSAYPESAVAGALKVQLGGKASYFGVEYNKKTMGDSLEELTTLHLNKARYILYGTSIFSLLFMSLCRFLLEAL